MYAFEDITCVKLNYSFTKRRSGDIISAYAVTNKANKILVWKSEFSLIEALHYAWEWEKII